MVTQITLGNIYQSNGKTVIGGSQSQLDTEGIIKALTEARRLPAVRLETRNDLIDQQLSAYGELKSLLARFQSAADVLRNPPGVNNASQNIFKYSTASLTSNSATPAANYLGMTVQPGVSTQNFTINEIEQLAREAKQESNLFTLPNTAASVVTAAGDFQAGMLAAGSFSLRAIDPDAADATITLNEGDSLQAVVNKFNEVREQTGIQANILKVAAGTPDSTYKIIFTSTKTGEAYDFDLGDAGTVTADDNGVLSQLGFNTTQSARNALLTIDGVDVERESNAINDLIEGITFNLLQATPDGTVLNAAVKPDTEIVQNAIVQFADIYNEFRLFAAKQQELGDDGLPIEDAVLANQTQLRTIISQMASEMTRVVGGIADGNPERLADVGITFSDFAGNEDSPATKNIMVVDTEKLSSALAANFTGVRDLFEFRLTSDNANLAIFSRTNALAVSSFQLTINRDTNTYQATYDDPVTNTPVTVDLDYNINASSGGITLTGKAGTALEGLQLLYAVSGNATINVKATQGYGDRLYNLMQNITNSSTGSLTRAVQALEDQQSRNEKEIETIDSRITLYRDQLTRQYAALESALTQANQLLSLLAAQASARESNS